MKNRLHTLAAALAAAALTPAAWAQDIEQGVTVAERGGDWLTRWFFRGSSASTSGVNTDGLFMMIFWLSVFFFVVLMGLSAYWVVKYRRRPGVPAPRSPSHNTPLEVFWTVVPSSSLLVIFLLGFWGYMDKVVSPGDAIPLQVRGWKWGWEVTYPNGAKSNWLAKLDSRQVGLNEATGEPILAQSPLNYPIFVVPAGKAVRLQMHSDDVLHSFWIPDIRVKMDVMPNRYTGYGFTVPSLSPTPNEGELPDGSTYIYDDHWIFCAEYCGDQHAEMAAVLRVVEPDVYAEIIAGFAGGLDIPPTELGKAVWQSKCAVCHSIDGSTLVGPTWENKWGYEFQLSKGDFPGSFDDPLAWANYIRESIILPDVAYRQGFNGGMQSFDGQLSDAEINGVIAYIASLSDRGQDYAEQANAAWEAAGAENPGEGDADEAGDAATDPASDLNPDGTAGNAPLTTDGDSERGS